jgi:hypothetical protein
MKPLALTTALALVLAGLALASRPDAEQAGDARLRVLRRDLQLVEALVDSGLTLAAQDDPLKRAETCNVLADRFARAVKHAAADEPARAAALGNQLELLLVRGVAGNLRLAHEKMPADSPRAPEAERLGDRAVQLAAPAVQGLEQSPVHADPGMRAAARALARARAEVEKAARGRLRLKGPPSGHKRKGPGR